MSEPIDNIKRDRRACPLIISIALAVCKQRCPHVGCVNVCDEELGLSGVMLPDFAFAVDHIAPGNVQPLVESV